MDVKGGLFPNSVSLLRSRERFAPFSSIEDDEGPAGKNQMNEMEVFDMTRDDSQEETTTQTGSVEVPSTMKAEPWTLAAGLGPHQEVPSPEVVSQQPRQRRRLVLVSHLSGQSDTESARGGLNRESDTVSADGMS